jgi:hypothetical protein
VLEEVTIGNREVQVSFPFEKFLVMSLCAGMREETASGIQSGGSSLYTGHEAWTTREPWTLFDFTVAWSGNVHMRTSLRIRHSRGDRSAL